MARKIHVTVKELEALRWICRQAGIFEDSDREGRKISRVLAALLVKVEKSHIPESKLPDTATIATLENALLLSGGRNVARMATLTVGEYTRLSGQIRERAITIEQMRKMGLWLRDQTWCRNPFTLWQVVHKWGTWFAWAEAHVPRRSGPALLEGD